MLDSSLGCPFFSRGTDGSIYGMDSSTEWHNENKQGTFMINQYHKNTYDFTRKIKKLGKKVLETEEMDDEEKAEQLKKQKVDGEEQFDEEDTDSDDDEAYDNSTVEANFSYLNNFKQNFTASAKIESQTFSTEVDFELFEEKFWPKYKGKLKFSAMNIWTEIFSVIKGGLQTDWSNYIRYGTTSIMSLKNYMKLDSSIPSASVNERKLIYRLFMSYEFWKTRMNYYDFMDVVKHVYLYFPLYWQSKIDYLIIDEVQDLTPLTIQLLTTITRNHVFFCGDTAQTIAKGVGFRFFDMKSIFDNTKIDIPNVIQLTRNYRSHGKILDCANTIVDVIEYYFPTTIDKLQRESSDIDGPKPILLEGFKQEDLMAMIIGHSETRNPVFGCNQVVIVRNQEAKATLPLFLKQALCLTVYEAKGLEFDDVILYNFFCDSHASGEYRILEELEVHTGERKKLQIEEELTLNELDVATFDNLAKQKRIALDDDAETETYTYFETETPKFQIDRKFKLLCNDLKHLYVSITRPKQRLLIYDEDCSSRKYIKNYWVTRDVVEVVHKGEEKDHAILKDGFETMENEASSQDEWRYMGFRLFRKKFYHSAITCFEKSGDESFVHRCYAYMYADNATSINNQAEVNLYTAKNNKNLSKAERSAKRTEAKKLKEEANAEYIKAAGMLVKIKCYKQAAQCFYT